MKRFHVHVHVSDLAHSISFYSKLFAAEPTRIEHNYAKWMLDDPRVNFALSTGGPHVGVGHLGFQTDDAQELAALRQRAASAELTRQDEGETSCCYARSEKHWITDPQGIAWEHFHTLQDLPTHDASHQVNPARGGCAPQAATASTAPNRCGSASNRAAMPEVRSTSSCC